MEVVLNQFTKALAESGLMTAGQVSAFVEALPPDKQPEDGAALARELVKRGKLTKFQAQAIYQGKTKGLIMGDYVVLDRIGQGGMGQVYKAQHRVMERIVALKTLPFAATKSDQAVKRFHRDIKPSNLLLDKHGTIKILDMGLARLNEMIGPDDSTGGGRFAGAHPAINTAIRNVPATNSHCTIRHRVRLGGHVMPVSLHDFCKSLSASGLMSAAESRGFLDTFPPEKRRQSWSIRTSSLPMMPISLCIQP